MQCHITGTKFDKFKVIILFYQILFIFDVQHAQLNWLSIHITGSLLADSPLTGIATGPSSIKTIPLPVIKKIETAFCAFATLDFPISSTSNCKNGKNCCIAVHLSGS